MKKAEFLYKLSKQLGQLSKVDIERSLEYYREMIDERIEDGLSENEAIEQIGTPEEIAKVILSELPDGKKTNKQEKKPKKNSALQIVLIILGSPIWLSLYIALIAVTIGVYAVIWSLVVTVFAVDLSFAAVGAACILFPILSVFTGGIDYAILFFSSGAVLAGLSILLFIGCMYIVKAMARLSKLVFLCVKKAFCF